MTKYVHRSGFVEAEQNNDGSYTINGVSRMTAEQFNQEFIEFPTKPGPMGEWLFFSNRPVDLTTERYKGLHESWGECFESGFECSICGKAGTVGIGPRGDIKEEVDWSIHDERTPFCPNCGSQMKFWEETYSEWKVRHE